VKLVERIDQQLVVSDCNALVNLRGFAQLHSIGRLVVRGNDSLERLGMPALARVEYGLQIGYLTHGNRSLQTIDLPVLFEAGSLGIEDGQTGAVELVRVGVYIARREERGQLIEWTRANEANAIADGEPLNLAFDGRAARPVADNDEHNIEWQRAQGPHEVDDDLCLAFGVAEGGEAAHAQEATSRLVKADGPSRLGALRDGFRNRHRRGEDSEPLLRNRIGAQALGAGRTGSEHRIGARYRPAVGHREASPPPPG